MTIRHLRIFKTVCEVGSFTEAAHKLYMTQPAVSLAIKELEGEAGCPLFDRIARKAYLNQTGKLFLQKVKHLLQLYEELEQGCAVLQDKAALRVGCCITIAQYWLPGIVTKFEKEFPGTPVQVEIRSAQQVMQRLENNELDVALMEGPVQQDGYLVQPFSRYKLKAVCAAEHPLAVEHSVLVEQFIKEKLLLREKGSAIREAFDSYLLLRGLVAEPSWTSTNSQALIQALQNNLGVSVLPDVLVQHEIQAGKLQAVKVNGMDIYNENTVVLRAGKEQTPSLQAFVQITQAAGPT